MAKIMELDDLVKTIEMQKDIANSALSRKGQRATNKPDRLQLLFRHSMAVTQQIMQSDMPFQLRTCIINASYPPSTIPLSQLKPMLITDLRLETHHEGRVIFVRAIAMVVHTVGAVNIIEDTSGDVDRLSVYNTGDVSDPQSIIRKNQVYAIKEPYYKTSMDGGYGIRVDHPSDLILLPDDHDLMPRVFAPQSVKLLSAEAYKTQGNTHYKAKAYQLAIDSYGRGIQACTEQEQDLQADLHRNRAQVNLRLKRYEDAIWDARRSVEQHSGSGENANSLNCKALYRAGVALYALGRYQEAQSMYEKALQYSPLDNDATKALNEAKMRIVEATTGVYDMNAIAALNRKAPRRLDLGSYVKDVTIRSAGKRGRGLFAEKDFKTGDTIIFEKAFDICMPSDPVTARRLILNLNTNRILAGRDASLFYSLVEKLRCNTLLARQYLDLYSRDYKPKYNACEVDDCTVIDTFEVLAIVESNCFGTASTKEQEEKEEKACGIWRIASYMNHACDDNATRLFVGDMMLVRASRDIAKGEEIFTSYRGTESSADYREELQSQWGFECDCSICLAESKTPAAQRDRRRALLEEFSAVLAQHNNPVSQQVLQHAQNVYTKLQETYGSALYETLPRLDLVRPSCSIASAYVNKGDLLRAKPACLEVLRNFGVFVTIKKNEVAIKRRHGIVSSMWPVIEAAMYLVVIHEAEDKIAISAQFGAFARSMWLLMYPTMKGFKERFDTA